MGNTNNTIIKKELKKFYGSIATIKKRSLKLKNKGYSLEQIRNVLDGKQENIELLTLCGEVLLELKTLKSKKENKLDALVKNIQSL